MGKDPDKAVCDARGRVFGYEGLHIADASAIPTNLGVNPQHTIMALARYWSQGILAEA
jgi:choline dehydrogenase-like flavoprotein